ncbi:MAG: glycosyltransferase family 2 protein [Hyphomonas sp.]|nr:glycosyltransferase family 2 protein [Hyphomonas sp.]
MTDASAMPTYDERRVAIVIPLYNDAANIARAIEAAVNQKLPSGYTHEVIVVDDCSKDEGAAIAEDFARRFDKVTVLRLAVNQGPSGARNAALRHTDAGWFTPFDSDDVMEPTRIAGLLDRALENDLDIVADNLLITDTSAPRTIVRELWPGKPRGDIPLTSELFLQRSTHVELERSELGFLKPLIRRRGIRKGREAYVDALRFGEDFELYARMLLDGAKAVLTEPEGYYFVCRQGSASRSQGRDDHRKLALASRDMLRRTDISDEARAALQAHARYCEQEWASWALIEGVRAKNVGRVIEAFTISAPASLHVLGNLTRAATSRLTPSRGTRQETKT